VVAAVALAHFAGWQPAAAQMAHLCSDAEWYVGTRGGMMDQFAALLGRRDHALFLDCRPDATGHYDYAQIPLPATHRLLVVDSGVHHGNVRGEFNQRVAAGRAGVALLQRHFPARFGQPAKLRAVQEVPWVELAPHLPEQMTVGEVWQQGLDLGDIPGLRAEMTLRVLACCRHVWTENARVLQAVAAMRAGDVPLLGQLMNAAHTSARDDYQISCPELELLIDAAHQVGGVAGARLTGAGWGGCIIALVAAEAVSEFTSHIHSHYHAQTGRAAAIFPCRAGSGAGLAAEIG
jgi:galactokinase